MPRASRAAKTRPGDNKYSNSIIAIDVINKKKLWDFQEISHDIWNFDIPAPPILTSIEKNDIIIDVVVAVTKLGNTLILDRLTGEPIFDFHQQKAPQSKIPGEKTAYYQPKLKIPEPFSKQIFSEQEITNISVESEKFIKNKNEQSIEITKALLLFHLINNLQTEKVFQLINIQLNTQINSDGLHKSINPCVHAEYINDL